MTSKRAKLIADLFGDSKGFLSQAKLLKFDKKLSLIKDDELIDFSIFADRFRANFVNSDLLIHKALMAWHRMKFNEIKKEGVSYFRTLDDLICFIKEAYKGEELCSCEEASGFLPFVVILVDENGELRNTASLENGVYKRLDSSESACFYKWLFKNQHKIGDIVPISRLEYQRGEEQTSDEVLEFKANKEALRLIAKSIKRLKK